MLNEKHSLEWHATRAFKERKIGKAKFCALMAEVANMKARGTLDDEDELLTADEFRDFVMQMD